MSAPVWSLFSGDDFTRANASTLGSNWAPGAKNAWSIVSNRASMGVFNGNLVTQGVYRNPTNVAFESSIDQQIEMVLPGNQGFTSGDVGVALRVNGTSMYLLQWTPYNNGQFTIFSIVNGGATGQFGSGNWTAAYNATHTYRAQAYVYGTNPTTLRLRVYDDTTGTKVADTGEVTDSTAALQTAGYSGMSIWNVASAVAVSSFAYYLPTTTHYELLAVGDSLTSGTSYNQNVRYFNLLSAYLGSDWTCTNIAVAGKKVVDMNTDAAGNITTYIHRIKRRSIVICQGLTNDILDGITVATAFNRLKTLCLTYRAAGAYVLVPTIPPADGVAAYGYPSNFNTIREQINALIIAQWATFADGLVNMSNDTNIGVSGAEQNPAYFGSDKVHLNDAGNTIEYGYYLAAIQALNTYLDSAPIEAPVITLALLSGAIQINTAIPRRAQSFSVYKNGVLLGNGSTYSDPVTPGPLVTMPVYTAQGVGFDNPTGLVATATPFQSGGNGRGASISKRGR